MNRDKQMNEMRHLADEMGKAISTEYEKRVLADERKLEAVLIENGWRKASEVAREIFGMLREDLKGEVDMEYLERLLTIYEKKYTEGEG
jgi:hypothetical protein